jgi:hypothetical protein
MTSPTRRAAGERDELPENTGRHPRCPDPAVEPVNVRLGAGYYSPGTPYRQTRSKIRELERLNPGMKVTLTPIEPAATAA